jgi:BirA family biotin operon repressor/biotin-[acetyl-CoA-carboxylase] ligase
VICADFQEAGRGRTGERPWLGDPGDNLFFTLLLRYGSYASIPTALTLRTGLALSLAVGDLVPPLARLMRIKWPNDLMILLPSGARKLAGILAESDGRALYIGVGVNVSQREFPPSLRRKAGSLMLALEELEGSGSLSRLPPGRLGRFCRGRDPRFALLELILKRLHRELEDPGAREGETWRERLEERLYMKGEPVRFIEGEADSGRLVEGTLRGIGPGGELVLLPRSGGERSFVTGELDLYGV